jgi:hypothetical protein
MFIKELKESLVNLKFWFNSIAFAPVMEIFRKNEGCNSVSFGGNLWKL